MKNLADGCISFRFYIKPQQGSHFYPFGRRCISFRFYIKPQPLGARPDAASRCISFRFYIKPQPDTVDVVDITVVSHSVSTSNHNYRKCL